MIHFNKALQENEAKQTRARKRAEDENIAIRQRQSTKEKLERDLVELQDKSEKIDKQLKEQKKYEEYLEMVKDNNEEFGEINEIVELHKKLDTAN